MGPGVECVEDVVHEMVMIQQSLLPLRPTREQYEAALAAVARAEHILASRLEELVRERRPEGVPQPAFRALQEMREDVLRMQVEEHKRPWLAVIELEERHQRHHQLFQKVAAASGGTDAGSMANGGGATSVLNGIDSSSSGEFSDDVVANGQRFYAAASLEPTRKPAMATMEQNHYGGYHPDNAQTFTPDVSGSAPKTLSTIAEDGQAATLQCPPRLLAMIQAAAESGAESLVAVDMFVRENILLDDSISQLSNLRVLELSGNRIVKLPDSIGELSQLTVLDLQSNQLTALPDTIGRLTSLKQLNIEKNGIEELPWTIGNCESLEELRADFNQLKALPEAVGYLGNLRILSVHLNCLKSLPSTMAYLTSLAELDVHFNQLESVPESLCFVTTLRKLDISSNFHALRFLPYKIGNLHQLEELDISYNSILELPDSFVQLENLRKLRLEGNPWRVPPLQVTQKGNQAIFDYLHESIKQKQQEKLARKKRNILIKAAHACCGFFGRLCESKHGDSALNILA
ncbi:plant intracellular Ras-group-related LRR protein 4 [Selaginella moellendorffii]|nr:plant intracellular Ras-group-related LRR protein 4 [Selaginella moellendorffii]|eukprot:XP_002964530.2 plant intracellular Ras-group-related LRR protein 4 [Selaginella moellendorffii]